MTTTITDDLNSYLRCGGLEYEKQACQNKIDIYRDAWDYIIWEELACQFTPETYKSLFWLTTKELNILKRVVNELSFIYKRSPVREVYIENEDVEGEEIDDTPDENYDIATEGTNKNEALKAINKYTNLINHSALKISFINGKLDYQIYNFNNIEIYTSPKDWQKIIAIKYYVGHNLPDTLSTGLVPTAQNKVSVLSQRGTLERYKTQDYQCAYVWTADAIDDEENNIIINDDFRFIEPGKVYELKANDDRTVENVTSVTDNPLRYPDGRICLPFVIFDRIFPTDRRLDFAPGNDLIDITINTAVQMVLLNQIMKYQSFKQGVVIGVDPLKLPSPLFTDPQQWIALQGKPGEQIDVKTIDLQANYENFYKIILSRIQTVLAGYGVSPQNFTMSAAPSSGIALQISNMGKIEAREDQIDMYRDREKQIFEIERIMWNYKNPNQMIDIKAKFSVDFIEQEYPKTTQEEAAEYAYMKMYNAITDVDIIMEKNPDLSRDAAEQLWRENKALNTKAMALTPLMNRQTEEKLNGKVT